MGWMEVLALLKRMVPLLSRLAPMLEAFLAGRVGGRADVEGLQLVAGDIRGQLAATGEQHADLAEAVRAQAAQLGDFSGKLAELQGANQANEAALLSVQAAVKRLQHLLLALGVGLFLITAACFGLLLTLVLRHAR